MALKFKHLKKEEIPAEYVPLYVEKKSANGSTHWALDVEGAVEKETVDEFRTNNLSLRRQLDDMIAKFEGIDPEAAKALSAQVAGLKPEEVTEILKKGKDLEKLVLSRTEGMRTDYEAKLKKLVDMIGQMTGRLTEVEINNATVTAATKRGLRPTAILDITARARSVFRLVDGRVLAYEQDGKSIKYGKDATTPYSIDDWVEQQVTEAPHLFEPNKGAGGQGSGESAGAGAGENPWKKETFNVTKQMAIYKKDKVLAARLALAAGVKLAAE